ncbi:hypothetical protein KIW84_023280 [Lathyrus oleraceus]|uniref:Alpha-L-arabinofuranosidase C-terminal domain-containing protein n=1 Tax=Pisum sativum TaxID=3888 RepID=A0A9D5B692_PEA|nr:hypothetical protein KIW84_023280 [Pisum sativum]
MKLNGFCSRKGSSWRHEGVFLVISTCHYGVNANEITSKLVIDAGSGRLIPDTFFGAFFEEINHAGAGGLWAELVNNRGFEAGGSINGTSNIYPWTIIGENQSSIIVSTEGSSCFERNKIALRMDVLCHRKSCPRGGVGISNPGFWGMNIEEGKKYKVVFYVRSLGRINLQISFVGSDNGVKLASTKIRWKDTVGAWEERPGHYNDIWKYWTDDGFGYFEGLQAYVSEYAVWKEVAGNGSLYAAVAEAAFLIGLEKNSDVVSMVAYAPLFVNTNDEYWIPDAIVFNTYQNYGTPSYWLQQFFIDSNGAIFLNSTLYNSSSSIVASAIQYTNSQDGKNYLKVKIVPKRASLENASNDMNVELAPYSVTSFDLLI